MLHNSFYKFVLFCLITLLLFNSYSCKITSNDVYIFSDINECQSIKDSVRENVNIKIYDSPVNDKYLKQIPYREWFGCKVTSDDMTFELFAYEFLNADFAMRYFESVTQKKNNPNPTFSSGSGMNLYHRIVVDENNAYAVYCSKKDQSRVIEFLNSRFTKSIE